MNEIAKALTAQGAEVVRHLPSSDAISGLSMARKISIGTRPIITRSPDLEELVSECQPDVLLVHNIYPWISPSSIFRIAKRGTPIVHVIHNFRHSCVTGSHYRDGSPCGSCRRGRLSGASAVLHSCYRGSRMQSAVMVASNLRYYQEWRQQHYVAISDFMRRYLIEEDFSGDIAVIPNPVGASLVPAPAETPTDILFAGRLEPEKGLTLLLSAWGMLSAADKRGAKLHIAGSGSEEHIAVQASEESPDVVWHGMLPNENLERVSALSRIAVVPSLWDEPFGRTVVEALRRGQGVAVTDRGALPELIDDGRTGWISAADATAFAHALKRALASDRDEVADRAYSAWEKKYSQESVGSKYFEYLSDIISSSTNTRLDNSPSGENGND